jgi:hypothetical protein
MTDRSEFFSTTIGGIDFKGILSADGPYILAFRGKSRLGGVALGYAARVCEMVEPDGRHWRVCKYGNQPRIELHGFREADAAELADAFGMKIEGLNFTDPPSRFFWNSGAWEGLKDWVRRHPRYAARYARYDSYIPGWHERAIAENKSAVNDAPPLGVPQA